MSVIDVQLVEKSFGERRVLNGVSFAIGERDRVGIVGVNGSGKSTLLGIVAGTIEPDKGLVSRKRDLEVVAVEQEPRLPSGLTVIEALREGLLAHARAIAELKAVELAMVECADDNKLDKLLHEQARLHERIAELGGFDVDHEVRAVAAALELPPGDRDLASLSPGERRRVALARALLGRAPLLVLDEPTNHLDARTARWLEARLAVYPGALLLVTHDRYFLDQVATRILELDRGALHSYEGNYTRFLERQAERLDNENRREHERQSFVRRELDWIRRGPQARATKQQARIDRFDAAVAAKVAGPPGEVKLVLPTGPRLGKTVLDLSHVSKSLGGKLLIDDFSTIVRPGDRIGIVGPNGAGKSTLVKMILGELPVDSGSITVGLNTRFAYLDQTRADLDDAATVLSEVAGDHEHVELGDGTRVHVRTFLRTLLFDDGFADTPVGVLSGGERNRVQLAKLLRAGGNVLVLDEPTNDLDLQTLGVLEEALCNFPGCALVVSHDRWFLDRVATAILAFEPGGKVVRYEGNYSDYLARAKTVPPTAITAPEKKQSPSAAIVKPVAKRKLSYAERKELEGIESRIADAEKRVAELNLTLEDPATYRERRAEVPTLVAALNDAKAAVDTAWTRWSELDALAKL